MNLVLGRSGVEHRLIALRMQHFPVERTARLCLIQGEIREEIQMGVLVPIR
jgi:hypothetical protein